jgi:predicted RNase H-like nuclease (RuvC/YqgF family)
MEEKMNDNLEVDTIEDLESDVTDLERIVESFARANKKLQEEINELQRDKARLEIENGFLQDEVSSLAMEVSRLNNLFS